MPIEDDLIDFFAQNERGKFDRNVEAFLFRFGFFRAAIWPTLEEIGKEYMSEEGDARSKRELVRQKMEDKINTLLASPPLPSGQLLVNTFTTTQFVRWSVLAHRLFELGLVGQTEECNIRGLLNLTQALNTCQHLEIYDLRLSNVRRVDYKLGQEYFIVDQGLIEKLKHAIDLADTISGDFGLVPFSFLRENLGALIDIADIVFEAVQFNPDVIWVKDSKGETYYHFIHKKDGFVSCLGRIFSVTDRVHLNDLVEAMRRSVVRRQGKKARQLLKPDAIVNFIRAYRPLQLTGDWVTFSGERQSVRDIESVAVKLLREKSPVVYHDLYKTLRDKGYGEASIDDVIYHSPIISMDVSKGYGNYQYSLIGQGSGAFVPEDVQDEHEDWRNISPQDFKEKQDEADSIGQLGEEYVNAFLTDEIRKERILSFEWVSQKHPTAPFDFQVCTKDGNEMFIDVKSTGWGFAANLHISYGELCKMGASQNYHIFRVYDVRPDVAKLRISVNLNQFANKIIPYIEQMPFEIYPDSIVLDPSLIHFDREIVLIEGRHN